jgi:hypothetical protein
LKFNNNLFIFLILTSKLFLQMSEEVIYGIYHHGGPGPRWIAPHDSNRETPTFSESRALLTHWIKDRYDKYAPDASSYKSMITKEKETHLSDWIMSNPQVQAMYRYASMLEKIGFHPVVKIVIDDNDEIQVSLE